ncbi:MAG: glyoxalase [Nonomuraea muscovyensis]|nr:glyoxalase [Nonomuraea muscovyensis]
MPRPQLAGIHHVKIPVTDLPRSRSWYERVFGLTVTMEGAAAGCRGFDPIGFAIQDHADVQAWAGHLDELGIAHSPVIEASIGWLLVFNDPDDLELHLYTWAAHGVDHSARPGYGRPATRPPAPVR